MPRVKNQHYVPQFYLKGFSADGKNVFVFDKVAKKSFKTGVAKIGSEQLFYELPPGPSGSDDSQVVEKAFSVLEAGYSNAVQAGLLHHHRKSMNIKELRIRTWVNASDCPARSYAQSVAPGAVSSLLQATYVDQEKQRKSCPYKDLCLYC